MAGYGGVDIAVSKDIRSHKIKYDTDMDPTWQQSHPSTGRDAFTAKLNSLINLFDIWQNVFFARGPAYPRANSLEIRSTILMVAPSKELLAYPTSASETMISLSFSNP